MHARTRTRCRSCQWVAANVPALPAVTAGSLTWASGALAASWSATSGRHRAPTGVAAGLLSLRPVVRVLQALSRSLTVAIHNSNRRTASLSLGLCLPCCQLPVDSSSLHSGTDRHPRAFSLSTCLSLFTPVSLSVLSSSDWPTADLLAMAALRMVLGAALFAAVLALAGASANATADGGACDALAPECEQLPKHTYHNMAIEPVAEQRRRTFRPAGMYVISSGSAKQLCEGLKERRVVDSKRLLGGEERQTSTEADWEPTSRCC